MGSDAVCARHVSDQGDCLQDALRSGQRRVCGLRRILHRHPIAARRTVPPLAIVMPGWKSDAMTRAHSQSFAKRTWLSSAFRTKCFGVRGVFAPLLLLRRLRVVLPM